MPTKANLTPPEYTVVSPLLIIHHASAAIDYYKKVFGASELLRMTMPDEKICFAEIKIGDSLIILSDEFPETGMRSPKEVGGSPVRMHLYVEDVDTLVKTALAAGAKLISPAQDQMFGDRSAIIEDPFGHVWVLATHKESISRKEMLRRFEMLMRQLPRT